MELNRLFLPAALGALTAVGSAQDVGTSIPDRIELEGFTQTGAKSYDDMIGRLVLVEFFAYW